MNWFQMFSLLVIVGVLIYAVIRFLNRKKHRVCTDCQRQRETPVNWGATALGSDAIERDSDDESDLSSDSEQEEEKKKRDGEDHQAVESH